METVTSHSPEAAAACGSRRGAATGLPIDDHLVTSPTRHGSGQLQRGGGDEGEEDTHLQQPQGQVR
ncbi:hypothetical protein E2C01_074253 [Portunus trituberculatus]|uniref:Uncharacterized protein n=1 Tax=Portunus trituberculatus TaxID=210409 RepID=A0A5B7I7K2_PORTR|nr:hypothetical protein [Portunus trituberculatus]